MRIYSAPLQTRSFTSSPDGKRIFFAATQERSGFVRYDPRRGQFLPFLPGVPGRYINFSTDQRRVAYTTGPQDSLWTSLIDGSEKVQLIPSPNGDASGDPGSRMRVFRPRWSPDGNFIAFIGSEAGKPSRVYQIPSGGGTPVPITPDKFQNSPSWSPSGDRLIVTRFVSPGDNGRPGLYVVDVKTHKMEMLPGSESFVFAVWSPHARCIAAMRLGREIQLFDFQSGRWSPLATGKALGFPFWSRDGKWVYFQDEIAGGDQPIFRVRISDRKTIRLMGSSQLPQSDFSGFSLSEIGPDDAPVATVSRTNSNIYALDVDFP